MAKITDVLEMLSDGEWYTLELVRKRMKLNRNQVQQVASFLEKYEFVAIDRTRKKMKVKEAVKEFLAQEITS
jgi:DNA-binding IclR family transcriptional regulator